MTPLQTSEKFWRGIEKKNITLVTIYSISDPKIKSDELRQLPDIKDVSFGRIIIDADQTEIETNVTVIVDDKETNVSLITGLIKHEGKWKVKYRETMLALTVKRNVTEMISSIEDLAAGVSKEIEKSVDEVKEKAIPEIKSTLEDAEEELREKVPEIKNMIDKFLKSIEEIIKESFPVEEEPKTQET